MQAKEVSQGKCGTARKNRKIEKQYFLTAPIGG
jgi:hypothetical protein